MDGIANRFVQLQDLQESLLKQIREFKLTGDPNKLPDIVEANRLDDELQDLARELNSPADSSPSNERRRRSQISHQFTLIPALDIIKTEPNLIPISEMQSVVNTSRTHSIKSSSSSSPVSSSAPSRHSSIGPQRVYAVSGTPIISNHSTPQISASQSSSSIPQSAVSTPVPVATQLLSPRQRRRQIDSFTLQEIPDPSSVNDTVVVEPAQEISSNKEDLIDLNPHDEPPTLFIPPPIPSFGEFMKTLANVPSEESSEMSETPVPLEEAPDVSRSPRRSTTVLNYRLPERIVYEPEIFDVPKNVPIETSSSPADPPALPIPEKPIVYLPEPQVDKRTFVRHRSDTPLRSQSPLRDSNRRRSVFSKPDTMGSKFWESVHQQRIKMDKVSQTLVAITSLLEIHRADSNKIRVGAFGILGEYLFEKQRKWINRDNLDMADVLSKPKATIPSIFESIKAVLLIQRYFRRFVKRRRDRMEAVKSLANTESNDARDKLRKRRMERKAEKKDEIIN